MIVHLMGDRALLLECAPDDVLGYAAAVRGASDRGELRGIVDIVPAAATVLVKVAVDAREYVTALTRLTPADGAMLETGHVDIDAVYDGEDLDAVAAETGLAYDDIVGLHAAATYRVGFCGFAPGFAYLTGLDERLAVPRLPSPRTRVPAGSVAIAAGYTAVYPRESPGGWRLIGRTHAVMFDPLRSPAALLSPGSTVRFHPVAEIPAVVATARATGDPVGVPALRILRPGALALVQDGGRPGLGAIAVGASGAFDRGAQRLANRLVGNPEDSAALELLGGGAVFQALRDCDVAITGAEGPVSVNGVAQARNAPLRLRDGDLVEIASSQAGLRAYVALRGGVEGSRTLGSQSTDSLSGLGPPPLTEGDVVRIGSPAPMPGVDLAPRPALPTEVEVRVVRGPRWAWFDPSAHRELMSSPYVVSPRSDRIGVRLEGPPLLRDAAYRDRELAPEGMVRGALQVPPDGLPVLLGPDHPVTGGYPVIAVIVDADLDAVAQAPPGTPVRFRTVG